MLLAGMALSTAFTMLLMMLQASGDPRMAKILTWISGSTYHATFEQVIHAGLMMIVLLALVPLLSTLADGIAVGRRYGAFGGDGIDHITYWAIAAGGGVNGNRNNDHWPAEFYRSDGTAYRAYDGLSPVPCRISLCPR